MTPKFGDYLLFRNSYKHSWSLMVPSLHSPGPAQKEGTFLLFFMAFKLWNTTEDKCFLGRETSESKFLNLHRTGVRHLPASLVAPTSASLTLIFTLNGFSSAPGACPALALCHLLHKYLVNTRKAEGKEECGKVIKDMWKGYFEMNEMVNDGKYCHVAQSAKVTSCNSLALVYPHLPSIAKHTT